MYLNFDSDDTRDVRENELRDQWERDYETALRELMKTAENFLTPAESMIVFR